LAVLSSQTKAELNYVDKGIVHSRVYDIAG